MICQIYIKTDGARTNLPSLDRPTDLCPELPSNGSQNDVDTNQNKKQPLKTNIASQEQNVLKKHEMMEARSCKFHSQRKTNAVSL